VECPQFFVHARAKSYPNGRPCGELGRTNHHYVEIEKWHVIFWSITLPKLDAGIRRGK